MPHALVINPNTSDVMTAEIRATAERVFQGEWTCTVEHAPAGPQSLESWYDYHLASVCVLPLAVTPTPAPDGIVLACFGDPGLFALKEISPAPVVGIAEASMSLALLAGGKFGILAGMRRAVELMDSMVRTYGLESRYAGCESMDMRVLSFEAEPERTLETLSGAGEKLRQRGADVLLLGCAGLTAFVRRFQERVQVPVIDPVEAGCRMMKAMVESGLSVSHGGIYTRPAAQRLNRLERLFSPEMERVIRAVYPREDDSA
ncbi:MAG: aspartate/glutamate racemase family protein [Chloroflexota bacterium]